MIDWLAEIGLAWWQWGMMSQELPDRVAEHIKSKEFKESVNRGIEDMRAGRARPWPEVAKELTLVEEE